MKIPLLFGDKLFVKLAGAVNAAEPEFLAFSEEYSDRDPTIPPLPNRAAGESDGATKVTVLEGKQDRRILVPFLAVRNADDQNVTLTVGVTVAGVDRELDSRQLAPGQVWTLEMLKLNSHTHTLEQLVAGALSEGFNIALGTATGTKLGTAAAQKLGFFGATPVVQRTKAGDGGGQAWDASSLATVLKNLGLIDADNS